jgi:hypothetical protein
MALLLTPDTRKRPPQSGFVQTGLGDINRNVPEEDLWPGIASVKPVTRPEFSIFGAMDNLSVLARARWHS